MINISFPDIHIQFGSSTPERPSAQYIVDQCRDASFDSDRVDVLRGACRLGVSFSGDEALAILRSFDFDTDRERAAVHMASHMHPNDRLRMQSAFTFSSSWNQVLRHLDRAKRG